MIGQKLTGCKHFVQARNTRVCNCVPSRLFDTDGSCAYPCRNESKMVLKRNVFE
jgi:hypothetical protein